ncbi:MAG: hypothetical protein J7J31_00245 [Helicobacteraceae bacterium]|nr:hypothetical protein [Helicobacteraceae bacterium]
MKYSLISAVTALLLLSGCSTQEPLKPSLDNTYDVSIKQDENGDLLMVQKHQLDANQTKEQSSYIDKQETKGYEEVPNFLEKSSESISFSKAPKPKEIEIEGKNAKVSVESIPLNEFIDLIFSSVLETNYTVSEDVKKMKQAVTLNMQKKQPAKELFEVVKSILEMHGVALTQKNGVLFISKSDAKKEISGETMFIGYGEDLPNTLEDDETIMLFLPYNYLDPKRAEYLIRQAGISNELNYYLNDIHVIKGKVKNIRKTIELKKLLDKPTMRGMTQYLVELEHIEADAFMKRINTIFNANEIAVQASPTKSGIVLHTLPEINSLFVVSPKQEWIDMILYWKEKLDLASKVSTEPEFFTYEVQNRKADELAIILSQILSQKRISSASSTASTPNTKEPQSDNARQNKTPSTSRGGSIIADLPTNTIMMQLPPAQYREILPILEQLDRLPLQVVAEVTLAEVTLTDTFSLGFEHALKNNKALEASPFELAVNAATGTVGGSGFSAILQSENINTAINAYAEKKLLSILSKPKLMMLNNEAGSINVGQQVPIITSEVNSNELTATTRNVNYRSTGVNVTLTPTINSNGVVTMKINLNLSEAQLNSTSGIDSPLIVNRTLTTTLTLKDNETILLGGLISSNNSKSKGGVPYLKDIPWLGGIFASQGENVNKTELIMLIKPQIIKSDTNMQAETLRYQSIMKLLSTNIH